MYICIECGHEFEEGEERVRYEDRNECHGSPSYEKYRVCPECGGDYDEAVRCEECDHYAPKSELESGLCPDCAKRTEKEFQSILISCFSPAQREYLEESYEIA